jgi:hypothetical protein
MDRSYRLLPLLLLAACIGEDDITLPEDIQPIHGSAQVNVATTGENLDADGYVVLLDEERSAQVDANGQVTFSGLRAGNWQVTLAGVASNCAIQGPAAQTFFLAQGASTTLAFAVTCS